MSSKLDPFRRSFTYRLNLWYAFVFAIIGVSVYWFSFLLLSTSLERKDRELLEARLKEYAAIYQAGGLSNLKNWIANSQEARRQRSFFVRVVTPLQTQFLLAVPDEWIEFDSSQIDPFGNVRRGTWIRIPKDEERDFTLMAGMLFDGSVLQVGRSTSSRQVILKPFQRAFFAVLVPLIILGFGVGATFTHRAMQPVREIVATARTIVQTGRLNARVPVRKSQDELQEMVHLVNTMLDKNEHLIRSMRDSLDHVAHDLRTPLARLRVLAETGLRQDQSPAQINEILADCVEETDRIQILIKTLLDVAEAESGAMTLHKVPCDISNLLTEVVDLYEYVAEEKRIVIKTDFTRPLMVEADIERLRRAFANLLDNALKYTADGGTVSVNAGVKNNQAEIIFKDDGIGIPPEELPRIWDRLFRGDKSRSQRGLGLGLSLVKAFVEAHKGSVQASSQAGSGSVFTVLLPLARN